MPASLTVYLLTKLLWYEKARCFVLETINPGKLPYEPMQLAYCAGCIPVSMWNTQPVFIYNNLCSWVKETHIDLAPNKISSEWMAEWERENLPIFHEKESTQNKPIKLKQVKGVTFKRDWITEWPLARLHQVLLCQLQGLRGSKWLPDGRKQSWRQQRPPSPADMYSTPLFYSPFSFSQMQFSLFLCSAPLGCHKWSIHILQPGSIPRNRKAAFTLLCVEFWLFHTSLPIPSSFIKSL